MESRTVGKLTELSAVVTELDPARLSSDEIDSAIRALTRISEQLEAARLDMILEFDRRDGAVATGHTSTTGYLKDACDLAGPTAREKVRVARALGEFDDTRDAYRQSRVSYSHVRLLAGAGSDHPDLYRDHQEVLLNAAESLSVRDFQSVLAHWRQAVDGPGHLDEVESMHVRRRLFVSETFGGMVRIDGEGDGGTAEPIRVALDAIVDRDARASTPAEPDLRTTPQRRFDALAEICRQWLDLADTPAAGGERPHVMVMIDVDSLVGAKIGWSQSSCGRGVDGEEARRLSCDAAITRLLFSGASQPMDVGRSTRTIPVGLRRAVIARDRTCRFPGCDRPPRWGDIHHIIHWARGGHTRLDNLLLLCRHHHRLVHEGGWRIVGVGSEPTFISSAGEARRPSPDPRALVRALS